jgi:hypothetical protein
MPTPTPGLRLAGRNALPRQAGPWYLSLPLPEIMLIAAVGAVLALP